MALSQEASDPSPPSATIQLRPLAEEDIEYGCGCSFNEPIGEKGIGRFLVMWLYEEKAKLRLGDQLYELEVSAAKSNSHSQPPILGEKTDFYLSGNGLEVKINCTTSRVCTPEDEACEATWFDGVMHITNGGQSSTTPVRGACGC